MKPRTDTNANNVDVRIVPSGTGTGSVGDITIGTTTGIKVSASNVASTYTSFSLTNNISKSGYLEVFTDTVRSLNNINNNNAYGTAKNNSNEQLTVTNAEVTDYNKSYNREPDYYTTKNVQLTDDRYLLMFDMHTAQTPSGTNTWKDLKNAFYPVMIMNGDNPVFGYMNGSGGPNNDVGTARGTGAGNYNSSHAMPQRAEFNGASGDEVYTEYLIKASAWDAMGMTVDEGGRYYNITSYDRDGARTSLIYDRYAELYTNGNGWGAGTGYNGYTGDWSYEADNNAITLDSMNYKNGVLLGRYKYPKLIANGNSKTGTAKVYMAYYDDGTGEIAFRNFQIAAGQENYTSTANNITFTYNASIDIYEEYARNPSGTATNVYTIGNNTNYNGMYVNISGNYYRLTRTAYYTRRTYTVSYYYIVEGYDGNATFSSNVYTRTVTAPQGFTQLYSGGIDNSGKAYAQYVNFTENTANGNVVTTNAEGRLTAVEKGSRYYDMAVTGGNGDDANHVVIVYYDEVDSRLKLIYSTTAVNGSSPTTNVAWTSSSVTFPDYVGTYCSMTLDSSNGIHIAAFDAGEADLKYFYLPSYSSTSLTNLTIDASGSVGHWTGIAICNDSDNTELYGKPVISYYNSTETGSRESIKMAYPKAAIGSIEAGIDSDGYTTGNWEYMTVPAITPPQGGDSKFQKVCLGFDTKGIPVLGFSASNLEFGKQLSEQHHLG